MAHLLCAYLSMLTVAGRATRAALRAVANSLGVAPRRVTLVRGPTSRRKVVEIATTKGREELLAS
jgi:uncharacterized protein YggU (UPF0235/DUF167 family)